ncbi:homoserine dehydrogenase [Solemya velum gill symbiont]|uniref:Homoserine dehydrogenase n=1 Tax=Solemya velum gill symbiont TaxID=2340 RepID=A0A0B0H6L8_SOVGS|nr:homoserine dehydrogenase [Solemya velum gill symbiont]KHF24292.1 homoserine dehydrogenase [Solemya velum gill symbiont]OOY35273.1 homoserine dehydrogenase [Solemya velum gill symbiont]OOY37974.1 homoserine dehydrogenase [Solemya velum gill symbiont]OOY39629.1 homoserine dehydrogenase [Solemya velum gill symbiont]OOY46034.1 homoserine dehydrogenase [Solemya velum gill symbiont]
MNPVNVGLLGLGTVGGGTLNVLVRNAEEISRRLGREIKVVAAAAREYDPEGLDGIDQVRVSNDAADVISDPDIHIVVELIGGYSPAREFVLEALANGKHVVTANKALIAMHGEELFAAAREAGVTLAYEAAVAGGIPILKAIREGLAGNRIEWVAGIINGTGNFILTEMRDKGRDFADVLKEAQELGYAEADPTFDVEGIDAAHKLAILASLSFGMPLHFEKTYTEGITKIEPRDVTYASELGYNIKHLGIARNTDEGVELRVHPTLVPKGRLIANVDGVMNAVLIKGDMVGPTLYYGAGAGSLPTASAVVADIIDVARSIDHIDTAVPCQGYQDGKIEDLPVLPIEEITTSFYLRMYARDIAGVMAEVSSLLAEAGISIEAMHQYESHTEDGCVPLVMLTHRVKEQVMNETIARIEALETIKGEVARIRMEHLD